MFNTKHRFSFFGRPKFEAKNAIEKVDRKVKLAMAIKVARSLKWSVVNVESLQLTFRSNEKWSSNAIISFQIINDNEVQVSSETLVDQRWDLGKNYYRVGTFINLLNENINRLTEVDKRNIQNTEDKLLGFFDYQEPRNFEQTDLLQKENRKYLVIYCIIVIVLTGVLFGYLSSLDLFVFYTREMIFVLLIWFAIYFGAKHGNLQSYSQLKKYAITSVLSFYIIQMVVNHGIKYSELMDSINFLNYIGQQVSSYPEISFLKVLQGVIVLGLIVAFIGYFFFSNLKLSLKKLKTTQIPVEIRVYAEYLVAKGYSNYEIKFKLSKKGVNDYQIQNKVLEMIRPTHSLYS